MRSSNGLIEGEMYAYRSVEDLGPEQRLALLDQCHADGWELVTRSVYPFPALHPPKDASGIDWEEFWYFKRIKEAQRG